MCIIRGPQFGSLRSCGCALGRLSANDGAGAHRPLSLVVPGCLSREIVCRRWVRCTSSAVPVGRAAFKLLTVCQVARFCRASRPRGRQLNRCIPGNQVALYTLSMAICHTEARVHAYAAARQTWRAALAVRRFFFFFFGYGVGFWRLIWVPPRRRISELPSECKRPTWIKSWLP